MKKISVKVNAAKISFSSGVKILFPEWPIQIQISLNKIVLAKVQQKIKCYFYIFAHTFLNITTML